MSGRDAPPTQSQLHSKSKVGRSRGHAKPEPSPLQLHETKQIPDQISESVKPDLLSKTAATEKHKKPDSLTSPTESISSESTGSSSSSELLPPLPSVKSYSEPPCGALTPGNPVHSPPHDKGTKTVIPRCRPHPPPTRNKTKLQSNDPSQPGQNGSKLRAGLQSVDEEKLYESSKTVGTKHRSRNKILSPESAVSAHQHRSRSPINWFLTETKSTPTSPDAALQAAAEVLGVAHQRKHLSASTEESQIVCSESQVVPTEPQLKALQSTTDPNPITHLPEIGARIQTQPVMPQPLSILPLLPYPQIHQPLEETKDTATHLLNIPHTSHQLGQNQIYPPSTIPIGTHTQQTVGLSLKRTDQLYSNAAATTDHPARDEVVERNDECEETRSEATTTYAVSPKSIELNDVVEIGHPGPRSARLGPTAANADVGMLTTIMVCAGQAWKTLCKTLCGHAEKNVDGTMISHGSHAYMPHEAEIDADQEYLQHYRHRNIMEPGYGLPVGDGSGASRARNGSSLDDIGVPTAPDNRWQATDHVVAPGIRAYVPNDASLSYLYNHVGYPPPRIPTTPGPAKPEFKADQLDLALSSPYTIASAHANPHRDLFYAQHAHHQQQPSSNRVTPSHAPLSTTSQYALQPRLQSPMMILSTPAASAWPFPSTTATGITTDPGDSTLSTTPGANGIRTPGLHR